jgi:CRISPR system Cascade subunit CasB
MTEHLSFDDDPPRTILLRWWEDLQERAGDRATLRRCRTPTEVVFEPPYHELYRQLTDHAYVHEDDLATVAGLAVRVDENATDKPLGQQMAAPRGAGGRPVLTPARFRRLLDLEDRERVFSSAIRVVDLLDGTLNLPDLATTVYWWNDRAKKHLAYDYYENAPETETPNEA